MRGGFKFNFRSKMNQSSYEVIIVGAGPAGLTAAKILAQANKKVLVLEKNEKVGNKVCAGGLTLKDFQEFNLPKSLVEKKFKSINLYINGHLIELDLEKPWIWTCNRKKLGKYQLDAARKAGAQVELNSEVVEVQKDFVILRDGRKFSFQYLIGADGSNSFVRRLLGLETRKILLALQYFIPQKEFAHNELEVYFDLKRFGPTYAWIFPHQNYYSAGAGADPQFISGKKLKQNFEGWCTELKINPSKYKLQGAPINYDYRGVEFDNIFLVGDAAGLPSGLTGEGVHPAMVSGQEVAFKILNPNYNLKKIEELLKAKKFEERVLSFYKTNKTITMMMLRFLGLSLKSRKIEKQIIKFLTLK